MGGVGWLKALSLGAFCVMVAAANIVCVVAKQLRHVWIEVGGCLVAQAALNLALASTKCKQGLTAVWLWLCFQDVPCYGSCAGSQRRSRPLVKEACCRASNQQRLALCFIFGSSVQGTEAPDWLSIPWVLSALAGVVT